MKHRLLTRCICGRGIAVDRGNGLCESCDSMRLVKVACPQCRKTRLLQKGTLKKLNGRAPYCAVCAQLARAIVDNSVPHVCCDCGGEVRFPKYRKWLGRCRPCAVIRNKRVYLERKARNQGSKPKRSIELHGCVLTESPKFRTLPGCLNNLPVRAPRCTQYTTCRYGMYADMLGIPEGEQCLTAVRKIMPVWRGWRATGPGHPMSREEIGGITWTLFDRQGSVNPLANYSVMEQ